MEKGICKGSSLQRGFLIEQAVCKGISFLKSVLFHGISLWKRFFVMCFPYGESSL